MARLDKTPSSRRHQAEFLRRHGHRRLKCGPNEPTDHVVAPIQGVNLVSVLHDTVINTATNESMWNMTRYINAIPVCLFPIHFLLPPSTSPPPIHSRLTCSTNPDHHSLLVPSWPPLLTRTQIRPSALTGFLFFSYSPLFSVMRAGIQGATAFHLESGSGRRKDEARPLVQVSALSLLQCLTLMAGGGKDIWRIKNDVCMYVPFVFCMYTPSQKTSLVWLVMILSYMIQLR